MDENLTHIDEKNESAETNRINLNRSTKEIRKPSKIIGPLAIPLLIVFIIAVIIVSVSLGFDYIDVSIQAISIIWILAIGLVLPLLLLNQLRDLGLLAVSESLMVLVLLFFSISIASFAIQKDDFSYHFVLGMGGIACPIAFVSAIYRTPRYLKRYKIQYGGVGSQGNPDTIITQTHKLRDAISVIGSLSPGAILIFLLLARVNFGINNIQSGILIEIAFGIFLSLMVHFENSILNRKVKFHLNTCILLAVLAFASIIPRLLAPWGIETSILAAAFLLTFLSIIGLQTIISILRRKRSKGIEKKP